MSENVKNSSEEQKIKNEKKKSVLGKVKDAILPDQEEQAAIISTFVRLGVLVWSGGVLTLNYVSIPGLDQQKIDPTFIASVFTGVLSSFGIVTASKKGDGTMKMEEKKEGNLGEISKADFERLLEKISTAGPTQTLRIEQAPIKITTVDTKTSLDS